MSSTQLRLLALTALTLSAIVVGAYIVVIALHDRGQGPHLGGDIIVLLYAATLGIFTCSLALWFLDWTRRKAYRLSALTLVLATTVLGGWMYLNLSGRVISYKQMIDRSKHKRETGDGGFPSWPHLGRPWPTAPDHIRHQTCAAGAVPGCAPRESRALPLARVG